MMALACAGAPTEQAAGSGGSGKAAAEQPEAERPSAGNDEVRDFSVTSFTGEDFTLLAQRGSPVVLNFFESW